MAEVKRIVADFTPEAYEVLSDVAQQLNTSKADALRRALGLANFILRQQKEGWRVILEHEKDKVRKELVTP
jgi:hypothetical protein